MMAIACWNVLAGALGVPMASKDGFAQDCVAMDTRLSFRVTAAFVVKIGGVGNAWAALFVGVSVKLAPEPADSPPPGVQAVEPATGSVVQTPAVATLVTALIAPAEVVTFNTGLVVQPVPLYVIVPDAPTYSEPPPATVADATEPGRLGLSSSWSSARVMLKLTASPDVT